MGSVNVLNSETSPTRTEGTIKLYHRVYRRLESLTRKDMQEIAGTALKEGDNLEPIAVVECFRRHEHEWSKASARLYKAALSHVLGHSANFDGHNAQQYLLNKTTDEDRDEVIERARLHAEKVKELRLQREKKRQTNKHRPNTSAQKAKFIPEPDRLKLIEALDDSSSAWSTKTKTWFQAAILTGLRPSEWKTAQLVWIESDEAFELQVRNAKDTNERTFGPKRTLLLSGMPRDELAIVQKQIEFARSHADANDFEPYYKRCRDLFHRTANRLWPKRTHRPTLYTGRHIFAANAKSKLSKTEVAALMGHGSDRTAGQHYARAFQGSGSLSVAPSTEDVAAVAVRNEHRSPRTSVPEDGSSDNRSAV